MANQLLLNVYQINNSPVTGTISKYGIPVAGSLFRPLTSQTINGVNIYSLIQLAGGAQFYVVETVTALVTAANT